MLGNLTEVPIPTRFLFILLGPKGNHDRYHEVGRAIATLMADEVCTNCIITCTFNALLNRYSILLHTKQGIEVTC